MFGVIAPDRLGNFNFRGAFVVSQRQIEVVDPAKFGGGCLYHIFNAALISDINLHCVHLQVRERGRLSGLFGNRADAIILIDVCQHHTLNTRFPESNSCFFSYTTGRLQTRALSVMKMLGHENSVNNDDQRITI